ncbi:nucleoside-diphosphate kinase [Microcoleus sp. C2C3]|uniref:nucleoside-diphosphate kinase n=1 Tax=unclassified Microcoleus TaxID=2642155 RepID=UPI002FCFC651
MERTFLAIKPDGVQRGLVGEIIGRFEAKGFKLVGMKLMTASRELAEQHYGVHKERPFFAGLVDFITSGPLVAMVWEGDGVVASARKLIGATNPLNSEPGTIRGDLAVNVGRNIIHGSDAVETAREEISLWFKDEELSAWTPSLTPWIVE